MHRILLFLFAIAFSTGIIYAQAPPPSSFDIAAKAFGDGKGTGNYLLPVAELRKLKQGYKGKPEEGILNQALATYFAFAGQEDSAYYYFYNRTPRPTDRVKIKEANDAKAIRPQLEQRQIIAFNEAHTQPKGRAYVSSWLPELYKAGFRYLALEALEKDSALAKAKMPTLESGFYVREPQMANLIRHALKLGFTVVGYDDMSENRERRQAEHILAKTLAKDPKAKVVILAGHSHIDEDTTERLCMAAWLRKLSGIDPFTIDQTRGEAYARPQEGSQSAFALVAGSYPWPAEEKGIQADLYIVNQYRPSNYINVAGKEGSPMDMLIPKRLLSMPEMQLHLYRFEEMKLKNPAPVFVQIVGPEIRKTGGLIEHYLAPGKYAAQVRDKENRVLWQETYTQPD